MTLQLCAGSAFRKILSEILRGKELSFKMAAMTAVKIIIRK